jgi:hypothetical protein
MTNELRTNEPPAALLRCANCGTALGNHSSISFACPTASVGYFTAPGASESRGSVPDDLAGRVHDEIMRLDGGVRRWEHMGESQRAAWRNGLSILTPTPPAVSNGEPTAEQWRSAIEACFCGSIDDAEWSRITALARSAAAEKPR